MDKEHQQFLTDSRNAALDFWRLTATLLIVCLHQGWKFSESPFTRCYLVVDFFFIINGFFIAHAFEKNNVLSPADWMLTRVRKVYPVLWYSLAVLLALKYATGGARLSHFITENTDALYEMFFVSLAPLTSYHLNIPAWYLTPFVLGGGFLCALLRASRKATLYVVVPLCAALGVCYMTKAFGKLDVWGTTVLDVLDVGFVRGLSGMCMGILTYFFCQRVGEIRSARKSMLIEAAVVLLLYKMLIHKEPNTHDVFVLPLFSALIFSCYNCKGAIRRFVEQTPWIQNLSKYSLVIYLCHPVAITYGYLLWKGNWGKAAYLISAISFSVLSYFIIYSLFPHLFRKVSGAIRGNSFHAVR